VRALGRKCVRVVRGDRIGVYNINSTGALPYKLELNANVLTHTKLFGPIQVGENITFDQLRFPHRYAVAAYVLNGWCHAIGQV